MILEEDIQKFVEECSDILYQKVKLNEFLDPLKEELVKKWFATKSDMIKIHSNGHMIGNHGCTHKSYDLLTIEELDNEIINSHKILSGIINSEIKVFAHPQGGDNGNKNRFVVKRLATLGYSACFNGANRSSINSMDQFSINRIDAAELPPRKKSNKVYK